LEDLAALPQLISQLRDGSPIPGSATSPSAATAARSAVAPSASSSAAPPASKKKYEPLTAATIAATGATNGNGSHSAPSVSNGAAHSHQPDAPTDAMPAAPSVEAINAELDEQSNPIEELSASNVKLGEISEKSALGIWRQAAAGLGGLAAEKAQQ